ncbi:hypothetical protein CEXT_110731 [Caerostris extrusa]|uniref:Uncharacterized protein n=1 Tax=Caerostris extrusa TaxID=172846 RepID=A0AAV4Y0G9_CAEEX|nr:hypothetical protein CEXT_110731 [Caerostris extrusa]
MDTFSWQLRICQVSKHRIDDFLFGSGTRVGLVHTRCTERSFPDSGKPKTGEIGGEVWGREDISVFSVYQGEESFGARIPSGKHGRRSFCRTQVLSNLEVLVQVLIPLQKSMF